MESLRNVNNEAWPLEQGILFRFFFFLQKFAEVATLQEKHFLEISDWRVESHLRFFLKNIDDLNPILITCTSPLLNKFFADGHLLSPFYG